MSVVQGTERARQHPLLQLRGTTGRQESGRRPGIQRGVDAPSAPMELSVVAVGSLPGSLPGRATARGDGGFYSRMAVAVDSRLCWGCGVLRIPHGKPVVIDLLIDEIETVPQRRRAERPAWGNTRPLRGHHGLQA